MKLATLKVPGKRDGALVVVSRDLTRAVLAAPIAATLQSALDQWDEVREEFARLSEALNGGEAADSFPFEEEAVESPLPRAYQWLDGSTYLSHYNRIKHSMNFTSGHEPSPGVPLMYQGSGDDFQPPRGALRLPDEAHQIDYELELVVVLDDVPLGVSAADAADHVVLVGLINDVSLRGLITAEMATGFGPIVAKPSSALAPVLVTPDELGDRWSMRGIDLPACVSVNGQLVADPNASGMAYGFDELIARASTTRALRAGTVIGSGTVSVADDDHGYACIAERRAVELVRDGAASTPFLKDGDRFRIWMSDDDVSVFGAIEQSVVVG